MTRAVPEWVGATPDTAIPPRVKLRLFAAYGEACAECRRPFRGKDAVPEYDHILALVNGGEHRESNLRPLCRGCHAPKTAADVAVKAKNARVAKKRIGAAPKRSRFATSRTGAWKAKVGGQVERR